MSRSRTAVELNRVARCKKAERKRYAADPPALEDVKRAIVEFITPLEEHLRGRMDKSPPDKRPIMVAISELRNPPLPDRGATYSMIEIHCEKLWPGIPSRTIKAGLGELERERRIKSGEVKVWGELTTVWRFTLPDLEGRNPAPESVAGYLSAFELHLRHGCSAPRLSDAARAGKVRTMPAPTGMSDGDGKAIRKLYNESDAIKNCSPKRCKHKSRQSRA